MSITKAFLVFLFFYILNSLSYRFYYFLYDNYGFTIGYGESLDLSLFEIIVFLVVLGFIFKTKPALENIHPLKASPIKILALILLTATACHFMSQPLYDIPKLVAFFAEGKQPEVLNIEYSPKSLEYVLTLVVLPLLIVAPVFEELLFRKYIMLGLLQKNSVFVSIIISSILFSFIHVKFSSILSLFIGLKPAGTPYYMIFFEITQGLWHTFVFGIIASVILIKTKKIIYPIFFHLITNLIVSLGFFTYQGWRFTAWLESLRFNHLYWAIAALGAATTFYFVIVIASLTRQDTSGKKAS